jgi:hypothetical protein
MTFASVAEIAQVATLDLLFQVPESSLAGTSREPG